MNSGDSGSDKPPEVERNRVLRLTVMYVTPSLNVLLGMNHWKRMKLRHKAHDAFESTLRTFAEDSSTKTTSSPNTSWTASVMLERFLTTTRDLRESRRTKGSARRASSSTPK